MKKRIKYVFFKAAGLLLLLQMNLSVQAQIPAPEILCVSKDTILWNLPDVTCGEVDVYEIYVSQSLEVPFEKLVVIINPQQKHYYHQNSSGETRYYYMTTRADCPGMYSESSDTINNIPPPKIPISLVTVEDGKVRIEWEKSSDDQVKGYVIYKATSSGTIPIDTVYDDVSFYIDETASVFSKSEYYYVISLDDCGNPGLFDITHRTIFAQAKVDSCARTINLNWNPYEGWGDELKGYQVYRIDENDGHEERIGELEAGEMEYTVPDIQNNQRYCFIVRAIHADGRQSASQELCLIPHIARKVRYSNIYNASVDESGEVEVLWEWNSDAQLSGAYVQVMRGSSEEYLNQISFPGVLLSDRDGIIDTENDPSMGKLSYTVNSRDVCDTLFSSRKVSTIFLQAETMVDFNVKLNWTDFTVENTSDVNFYLQRIFENNVAETFPVNGQSGEYYYPFNPNELENYESCYRLGVEYTYTFKTGDKERITMYSNIACPTFEIKIQVPNAMVYQGINSEFKPLFLTPQLIEEYSLEIYSRNGQRIFVSRDVTEGWDGTVQGKVLPQGTYIYKISATKRGDRKELKGHFVLLY